MTAPGVETISSGGLWRVRIDGEDDTAVEYSEKDFAVQVGREEAMLRGVVLLVRDQDGNIEQSYHYG
jgi:hypothetical protein